MTFLIGILASLFVQFRRPGGAAGLHSPFDAACEFEILDLLLGQALATFGRGYVVPEVWTSLRHGLLHRLNEMNEPIRPAFLPSARQVEQNSSGKRAFHAGTEGARRLRAISADHPNPNLEPCLVI